jgi:NTE family protein
MRSDTVGSGKNAKPWGLVLMGGGARGLAHVGVLRVLEKNELNPDVITGTSMGGIVGGLYAAGFSAVKLAAMVEGLGPDDTIEKRARRGLFKRPRNLFEYLMQSEYRNRFLKNIGLEKEDAIEGYLKALIGDVRIESLPIKFVCNAVDLVTGKEVFFCEGKLAKALRATMSLPLLFPPARAGKMILLDGGVLDNAPVEAARQAGAEVAVLVDIHRPLRKVRPEKVTNTLQVIQRMIEMARAGPNETKTRLADFVLRVPVDVETLDFSDPRKIVRMGERTAAAKLEALKKAIR